VCGALQALKQKMMSSPKLKHILSFKISPLNLGCQYVMCPFNNNSQFSLNTSGVQSNKRNTL
jgi:hypothetical protein